MRERFTWGVWAGQWLNAKQQSGRGEGAAEVPEHGRLKQTGLWDRRLGTSKLLRPATCAPLHPYHVTCLRAASEPQMVHTPLSVISEKHTAPKP